MADIAFSVRELSKSNMDEVLLALLGLIKFVNEDGVAQEEIESRIFIVIDSGAARSALRLL